MKRTGSLLLALALASVGCVELPIRPETKPAPTAKESARFTPEPTAVRPEQVNDGNARQALDGLRNELDRAADEPAPVRMAGPDKDR